MNRSAIYHTYYVTEIEKRPRVTVAIPLDLYDQLSALATREGVSKPALMRKALQEYIRRARL